MINGIEITDVIIFPIKNKISTLKAFAQVILNDQFIVLGIRIIQGKNGMFIQFPHEYNKAASKGYDICYLITAELRSYMTDKVLDQYKLALNQEAKQAVLLAFS